MYRKPILISTVAAALALAAGAASARTDGDAKLAKMLQGRVAGQPADCIPADINGATSLTIVDGTALVYRKGRTIYVNRVNNPETLDWDDLLVVERFTGTQLCRHDRVYTHDRLSMGRTGIVFLGEFVPYTKAG